MRSQVWFEVAAARFTHTAIVTPGYASTTETSNFLVARLGAELLPVNEPGPLPSMHLTEKADLGGFHVRGFAGHEMGVLTDKNYLEAEKVYNQGSNFLTYLNTNYGETTARQIAFKARGST